MQIKAALKELVHRSGMSQRKLATQAGYKTVSCLSTPIANNDMQVSTLVRLAEAAGYDLMLVRRNAIEPEYPIKIDPKEVES